jgi:DNA-binding IclR family transcriptional regulator
MGTNTAAKKSVRRRIPKWALQNGDGAPGDEVYYLRSIGRALDVLDCFDGQTPLSLKEISAKMRLPESTLFRVLRTLERHEYLHQDRDGTYQLSPRLIFGWLVRAADHVREVARPQMERLVNTFNETASLAFLFDDRIHVLDCMETFHEIRMTNKIGRVLPPHCSALGKAITAFQDRRLADRMLEVYGLTPRTEHTITDRQRLFAEFNEIRESGVACDREQCFDTDDANGCRSGKGDACGGAGGGGRDRPTIVAGTVPKWEWQLLEVNFQKLLTFVYELR